MSLEFPEPQIRRHPGRGVEIAYDGMDIVL